jgi:Ca2+-binding EF-hand superfamily protein
MKTIIENKHTKGHMKKMLVAITLAAALPALTALAQPAGRGPRGSGAVGGGQSGPGGHRPPPSPVVMVLDANGDGVIDAQEIANTPAALATLDTNGDGKLTPDELRPPPPQNGQGNQRGSSSNSGQRNGARAGRGGQQQNSGQGQGGDHPTPPLIQALDANGDGTIDAQEIANSSTALKSLDANGDGQLTHDEFCPPPPDGGPDGQQ